MIPRVPGPEETTVCVYETEASGYANAMRDQLFARGILAEWREAWATSPMLPFTYQVYVYTGDEAEARAIVTTLVAAT